MSWLVPLAILLGVAVIAQNLANSRVFRRGGRRPAGTAGLPQAFAWLRHRAVVVISVLAIIGLAVIGILFAGPVLDWASKNAGAVFWVSVIGFVTLAVITGYIDEDFRIFARLGQVAAVVIALMAFSQSGVGQWIGSVSGSIDRAAGSRSTEIDRNVHVYRNYVISVPVGGVSETLTNSRGRCLAWRPAEGYNPDFLPPAEHLRGGSATWVARDTDSTQSFSRLRFLGIGITNPFKIEIQERKAGECSLW